MYEYNYALLNSTSSVYFTINLKIFLFKRRPHNALINKIFLVFASQCEVPRTVHGTSCIFHMICCLSQQKWNGHKFKYQKHWIDFFTKITCCSNV